MPDDCDWRIWRDSSSPVTSPIRFVSPDTSITASVILPVFVDLADYAEAAAEIIASGAYTYGTYEFCSEGAYSRADMERILSELTGCRVTSALISDADFLAATHGDADSYAGQTLLTMFRHYNANGFCGNAFTLTQILGRRPVTICEYLKKNLLG